MIDTTGSTDKKIMQDGSIQKFEVDVSLVTYLIGLDERMIPVTIREVIPKDKHDLEAVRRLDQYSSTEIIQVLPALFEWLQDINWPVAQELIKLLPKYGLVLVPHIQHALNSGDPQWQFTMLQYLIRALPKDVSVNLVDTIKRVAFAPTQSEILEELHTLAIETSAILSNGKEPQNSSVCKATMPLDNQEN